MNKAGGTRRGNSESEEFKNKVLGKRVGRNQWVLPMRMKGDVMADVPKSLKGCGEGCRASNSAGEGPARATGRMLEWARCGLSSNKKNCLTMMTTEGLDSLRER